MEIGTYNELRVIKKNESGFVLTDAEQEVLLLAGSEVEKIQIGDNLHVFVYVHSDGRLMATQTTPLGVVGGFALLEVVDNNEKGAFLNLGIGKDVFVPSRDQRKPMQMGKKYVVYLYLDEQNQMITGSTYLSEFVDQELAEYEVGDEVSMMIFDESELGYSALIDKQFIGLIYKNEVFESLELGEFRRGFIKKIREENKIDLSLQVIGFQHILETKDIILQKLKENGGLIQLGDKSSPDDIYRQLKISKKAFKKAAGSLYKERLVKISDHEIHLVNE